MTKRLLFSWQELPLAADHLRVEDTVLDKHFQPILPFFTIPQLGNLADELIPLRKSNGIVCHDDKGHTSFLVAFQASSFD